MKVTGEYTYKFPERLLTFSKFKGSVLGGSASGEIDVEHLPGPSRITLNLNYSDINALDLARVYPWDPKYRIDSTVSGKISGWFEGKFERYDVNGHADLKSFTPSTTNGVVPLPLDGSLDYQLRPREARVSNGALQLYSTAIRADGLILPRMSDLRVNVNSGDLKDLSFIYADANGSGSFDGTITGDIAKPLLNRRVSSPESQIQGMDNSACGRRRPAGYRDGNGQLQRCSCHAGRFVRYCERLGRPFRVTAGLEGSIQSCHRKRSTAVRATQHIWNFCRRSTYHRSLALCSTRRRPARRKPLD